MLLLLVALFPMTSNNLFKQPFQDFIMINARAPDLTVSSQARFINHTPPRAQ